MTTKEITKSSNHMYFWHLTLLPGVPKGCLNKLCVNCTSLHFPSSLSHIHTHISLVKLLLKCTNIISSYWNNEW